MKKFIFIIIALFLSANSFAQNYQTITNDKVTIEIEITTDNSENTSTYSLTSGIYTFHGRAVDPNGDPIFGADVSLTSVENPQLIWYTTTNENGEFEFTKLEAGVYILTIAHITMAVDFVAYVTISPE